MDYTTDTKENAGPDQDSRPMQLATGRSTSFLQDNRPQSAIQKKQVETLSNAKPVQRQANKTGLPDNLRSGIENLSGHAMDDVSVHYNSDKPAQLNAHAYAQGTDIHIASGQEKHLPHEAWHVVQQKQGRVKPTMQMKGKVNVNDDDGLEKEADVMGAKAVQKKEQNENSMLPVTGYLNDKPAKPVVQGAWVVRNGKTVWEEKEPGSIKYRKSGNLKWRSWWKPREFNELLDVHEALPEKTNVEDLDGFNGSDLFLDKKDITADVLATICGNPNLEKLEFRACKFFDVNSAPFAQLTNLKYLSIYSPNAFEFGDGIGGIAAIASLRTLALTRCDFVHSDEAYAALGTMTQLSYLDLTRTLTTEKSDGDEVTMQDTGDGRQVRHVGKINPTIVTSLQNLTKNLSFLNIEACSALSKLQVQAIVDEGHINGCVVKNSRGAQPSPRAELTALLDRLP